MRFKTKIITLSALAAGLCLSLVSGALYSYRGSESRSVRPLSAFLQKGNVSGLVFISGGRTVTLAARQPARAGRSWTVLVDGQDYPAARNKAERFLELAGEASVSPALTENREKWPLFALGDGAEKRVVFSSPAGRTEILLGREEEAGRGQYIRFEGSDAVYLMSQSFSYYAERDTAYWSELRVFPAALNTQDIIAMKAEGRVQTPSGAAEVSWSLYRERKPEGILWLAEGDPERKLDQGKADSLAASISQINAKSFSPATQEEAQALITLTAADRTRYELHIGRPVSGGNYCQARVNGEALPYAYILDSGLVEKITAPLE
ncbi:MAG: DUF4340 domain-containing protein [Spirochaetia bacterium]|jgi:hypothetical protein|nr:DUF4340 domain-containing protein [Spirochaetia bacterium]